MNVHISYKVHKTPDIEREINHFLEKLNRRLRAFRPELVHLKGLIERNSPREGTVVSLNLRLPSGQMAVQESGLNALAALKAAFEDLISQIGKHKDLLRSSHKWRRRGVTPPIPANSGQDGHSASRESREEVRPAASADDIRSYVNAHLGRLERFVERELHLRMNAGQMSSGSVTKEEVVDEVVVRALGATEDEAEHLALEPWFYRLAIQSMNDLTSRASQGTTDLRLDGSALLADISISDDSEFQFRQPEEFLNEGDLIADQGKSTPEDIAYVDELISLVEYALAPASRGDREVFILHALEGFSVVEIAAITDRKPEEIRSSIGAARAKLRRSGPSWKRLRDKQLLRTGTD
jgi:RNA polymerase sigma factor (sigma-70 family)